MTLEQLYIAGFNNGYLLAKHESTLLTKVVENLNPANEYLRGIFSGKQEFIQETLRIDLDQLRHNRRKSINRETDFERDL